MVMVVIVCMVVEKATIADASVKQSTTKTRVCLASAPIRALISYKWEHHTNCLPPHTNVSCVIQIPHNTDTNLIQMKASYKLLQNYHTNAFWNIAIVGYFMGYASEMGYVLGYSSKYRNITE